MSTARLCLLSAAVALVLGLCGGFWGAWHLYRPKGSPAAPDQPHAAQQTAAGLLVREQPAAALPQPKGIPAGSRVVRSVHLEVLPHTPRPAPALPRVDEAPGKALADGYAAEPVKVDLDLVRQPDGHLRVLARAENGDLIPGASIDVPDTSAPVVAPAPERVDRGWAVGAFVNPSTKAWGPVVMKDLGPFRLAAEGRIERVQIPGAGAVHNDGVDLIVAVHF